MRLLGIDYGTKRIGVAISDEGGTLAFPKEILENNKSILEKLESIIKEENIKEIIIGESMDFKGEANKVEKEINEFTLELNKMFNLPIHLQKEFLTSVEARRYKIKSGSVDSSAAALILQRYLDKKNQALGSRQ